MTKNLSQKIFDFLIVVFILLIPWQSRFIYKDIMLDGQIWQYGRLSIYASMIVLLLASLVLGWHHREQWHLSKKKRWYFLVFYVLVLAASQPIAILSFYYLFLILGTILFIFLTQYIAPKKILWAFLLSGLLQSILAITQSMEQKIIGNKWLGISTQFIQDKGVSVLESGSMRILRAYGSLPHPNILGGFLVLSILAGLYLWYSVYLQGEKVNWQFKKIKKYLASICVIIFSLVLMSFALLATFSRSALLALGVACLFMLLVSIVKKDNLIIYLIIKYIILLSIVAVVFNMYYPGLWAGRFDLHNRLEAKSIQDRQITYRQFDWGNPQAMIFGQGLGLNTYLAYQKYKPDTVNQVQPLHNWFLLAWAEFGLVGVLMLLALAYFYLKNNFVKNKNKIYLSSFMIVLFVLGLFDHYFWTSWTGWLMVGLVVSITYNSKE